MRRYGPKHANFMPSRGVCLKSLAVSDLIHQIDGPPLLKVPKPRKVDEFRKTVGTRYPNSQIIPVANPMPSLEVVLQYLSGTVVFASCDAFKGFSRLLLHVYSQEIKSLLSESGIYTPRNLSRQGCWKHWEILFAVTC